MNQVTAQFENVFISVTLNLIALLLHVRTGIHVNFQEVSQ